MLHWPCWHGHPSSNSASVDSVATICPTFAERNLNDDAKSSCRGAVGVRQVSRRALDQGRQDVSAPLWVCCKGDASSSHHADRFSAIITSNTSPVGRWLHSCANFVRLETWPADPFVMNGNPVVMVVCEFLREPERVTIVQQTKAFLRLASRPRNIALAKCSDKGFRVSDSRSRALFLSRQGGTGWPSVCLGSNLRDKLAGESRSSLPSKVQGCSCAWHTAPKSEISYSA